MMPKWILWVLVLGAVVAILASFFGKVDVGAGKVKGNVNTKWQNPCPPGTSPGRSGGCLTDKEIEAEELAFAKSQGLV